MKRFNAFLLAALFCSSVTAPLQAVTFASFKNTLSGYKDCLLRKKACTVEQKKALAGVIGTLLAFVATVGLAWGNKWYQEQMATSWDGIKNLIAQYDSDVRTNFPQEKVTPFQINLLEKFKMASAKLSEAEKSSIKKDFENTINPQLNKLLNFVFRLGALTYDEFAKAARKNLSSFEGVKPEGIYQLLGFGSNQDGMNASWQEVKERIDSMLTKNTISQPLARQLEYHFRDEREKKLYDAYLQGKQEFERVAGQQIINEDLKGKQVENITKLMSALSDLG